MELKGTVQEHGTTRKEKKDETEYIHTIKAGEKGDFSFSIQSWDKELIGKIKQLGIFTFDPSEAEITVTIQYKVKKEKYDKEDENVLPHTGNPWFTVKKAFTAEELDLVNEDNIFDQVEIKFA